MGLKQAVLSPPSKPLTRGLEGTQATKLHQIRGRAHLILALTGCGALARHCNVQRDAPVLPVRQEPDVPSVGPTGEARAWSDCAVELSCARAVDPVDLQ